MPLIYNSEKFDSSLNTYRETFGNIDNISTTENNEHQYDASIIIPLDFSLEMDGISGIIPNSAFEIPTNILPKMYLTKKGESRIAFILHTVDHNFNNNKWTTKITGQTLNIRFDELSDEEKSTRKKQQESLNKIITDTLRSTPYTLTSTVEQNGLPYTFKGTNFNAEGAEARTSAESYLGRKMSDSEWTNLVKATFAEASPNQKEQAYVMAVMINRARRDKKTINQILTEKNQFQAVTGTSKNGYRPSSNFTQGPSLNVANKIYGGAVNILPKIPKDITKFTSNNPKAYKEGTNINYMYELRKTGFIVGQTVFSK
jgi:hypothetical protein